MPEADSIEPDETQSLDMRLVDVLDQYMRDRRDGTAPAHSEILARHPDIADELKSCLEGIDLLGDEANGQPIAGRTAIGDFELGTEIGRGGMGVVYEARQKSLGRPVALKILNLPISDAKVMERFQREAAMVASLQHGSIVPIYEVGSDNGTHFYAMQLIQGYSLAELIRDHDKPIDLDDVAQWGLQAVEALAHAHERGVIHRDIKPSNLILDNDQHLWLTDFGLARRMDDVRLSVTGAVLGTPRYMSPEQAATISAPVDERTDIYSLGATLYELACGQPAVPGDHPVAILKSIMNDQRSSPRLHRAEISRDLETILLRCLEKHPRDRYPNATSLAGDLRALIEHRPIASRPVSWIENSRRWVSENGRGIRWAACGGLAAILLLCTALWFALVYPTLDDAQISMSTRGLGLRADLVRLDGDSDPVSVAVPTTHPIVMDAGQWSARLVQPGRFSQDVRHWFQPGDDRGIMFPSPSPPLWTVDDVITSLPVRFEDGTDVMIVTGGTIERRDGETGEVIWSKPTGELKLDVPKTKQVLGNVYWAVFPESPESVFEVAPLCALGESGSAISDINGDGHPDLLLASFEYPAILALSGSDGSTLWTKLYAESFSLPPASGYGTRCLRIDAKEDGEVIALFTTNRSVTRPKALMARIDPADGSIRWKLDHQFAGNRSSETSLAYAFPVSEPHEGSRWGWIHTHGYTFVQTIDHNPIWSHNVETAPLISRDEDNLYYAFDNDLMVVDRVVGGEKTYERLIAADLVAPVQTIRGAAGEKRFLLATQEKAIDDLSQKERLRLTCYNADFSKSIWNRAVRADAAACIGRWTGRPQLPLVADLNHDGIDEVVVQSDRTDLRGGGHTKQPVWTTLQIIGADGKDMLSEAVRIPNADLQLLHVQVVDDRDDDGWDDLAVATRYLGLRDQVGAVHLELFGSRSGRPIWHQQLESSGATRRQGPPDIYRFQRKQISGREYLITTIVGNTGFDRALTETAIIDSADGRIVNIGSKLAIDAMWNESSPRPVLWCVDRSKPQRDPEIKGRRFSAFHFPRSDVLNVSQAAKPLADIDGDGMSELSVQRVSHGSHGDVAVVSPATGNVVRLPLPVDDGQNRIRSIGFDQTGNGKHDLLVWRHDDTLAMFEGGTRSLRWTLGESLLVDDQLLAVIPAAIESEQSKDLILITYAELAAKATFGRPSWELPLIIMGIGGDNGEVIWKVDFGAPYRSGGREPLRHAYDDINGDGRTDVVFCYFNANKTGSMYAISGVDGKLLWEIPDVHTSSNNSVGRFPTPVIIDTRHQKRIAFLTQKGPQPNSTGYQLVTADAQGNVLTSDTVASKYSRWTDSARDKLWGHHQLIALSARKADDPLFAFWIINSDREVEIHTRKIVAGKLVEAAKPWTPTSEVGSVGEPWKQWLRVFAADVDGDSADELIMGEQGCVSAYNSDGTKVWSHKVDASHAVLETIRRVGEVAECVFSYPAEHQSFVFAALDVSDGSLRWTMPGREYMRPAQCEPVRGMIDAEPLPTFVLGDPNQFLWTTVRADPVAGVEYEAAQMPTIRTIAATAPTDTRLLGPAPYSGPIQLIGGSGVRFPGKTLWSIIWSIFAIILPLALLLRIIIRRKFSLSMMLAMTAALSVSFAVLTIPVGNQPVTIGGRFSMGFSVAPFFVWLFLIIAYYRRGPRLVWQALLVLPLALLGVYELSHLAFGEPDRYAVASDVLQLWRGLLMAIPTTVILGAPLWAVLWFHRGRHHLQPKVHP